ncbi:MAG: DUF445 domain-containing protein [Burkholderiaceae bacterium]|jgi:uncharacterized membrane-anchored protein YjiN (DUF445 family)|nr:DUF445 domain-containing protein [Burkholderiaceae bacterium]
MTASSSDREGGDLRRAKRRPLLLLGGAALVFIVTALWPPGIVIDGIKAMSEAAMVGALADWFAVTALFRRVPVPFFARHSDVIARNKDRIGDQLAAFVRDKFLDVDSLVELLRRHDSIGRFATWMGAPDNAQRLGDYAVRLMSGLLGLTDDARIQGFIHDGLRAALEKVDLSKSAGALLDTLTRDDRHQELLDQLLDQIGLWLREEGARTFVAARIVDGLKSEYPKAGKILPSAWIGEKGASVLESAVEQLLRQISEDREHQLRKKLDAVVQQLITHLKSDPAFLRKSEELKASLLHEGSAFNDYTRGLWDGLRTWLRDDLERPDSALRAKASALGCWLGQALAADAGLRAAVNDFLEELVRASGPDLALALTEHISKTVRNWDARQTTQLIELKIGKDLQWIRINGTLIGSLIGGLLYLLSLLLPYLKPWLQVHFGV